MPNLCASLFKLMCSNVVCHHNNHLYLMDISKVYNVICKKIFVQTISYNVYIIIFKLFLSNNLSEVSLNYNVNCYPVKGFN